MLVSLSGVQRTHFIHKMEVLIFIYIVKLLMFQYISCLLLFKIPYHVLNILDALTKPFCVISKAVDMFQDDDRFKAVERARDREDLFDNFMVELQKKVKFFFYFSNSCLHLQT